MENLRKNHIYILVKKVKIKLFKGIHEAIKFCLNININRLPQTFIINIKIAFNQKYLYNADIRLLTFNRIDISSTDIRQRIRLGRSVRYMLPNECIEYICIKGLYK